MQPPAPETRDQLLQRLLRESHLLGFRLAQSHQRTAEAVGLGVTDLLCLETVAARQPLTAGRLAELALLTPGAITGVLDRLERGGFVTRERDPEDRRRTVIRLDPARQRDMARLLDPLAAALAEITPGMADDDLRQIADFVGRLHPAVAAEASRLRPRNAVKVSEATTVVSRAALTQARLEIAAGLFDVVLTGGDGGDDLLRSTFQGQQPRVEQEGATVTLRQRRLSLYFGWAGPGVIHLHPDVIWELALRGGGYRCQLQLQPLRLSRLALRGGHRLAVRLPSPSGTVPVEVSGGVDDLTLERPRGVPLRVTVQGGAAHLAIDDLRLAAAAQTAWQTPDFDAAPDRYAVSVSGGANKLTVGSW